MAWLDDFSFDFATGNLRHVSGATRYPVIDMHRGLQFLAAQATKSGDDLLDITDLFVPSKRNSDTDIELLGSVNVDATMVEFMYGGSIGWDSNAERYSGLALSGSFNADALPQVIQNNVKLTNYWGFSFSPDAGLGYAVRIMVLSRTGGADIDGGRVRGQSRGYGYQFRLGRTVLGRNESVCGIGAIAVDTFNSVAIGDVATYADITNTEGYQLIDYNNLNGDNPFYMQWTRGSRTNLDVYNRIKWNTRDGSAETLYGLSGELFLGITHEIPVDTPSGTLVEPEELSWTEATIVSTGQLLATDSTTAATKLYVQLLTGVIPTDGTVLTGAGAGTVTVNGSAIEKALGAESVAGNFTGSWITAFGVGMATGDVSTTDSLLDLLSVPQSPPNNQNVYVGGLISGEDYVIIGKSIDGGNTINKSEYAAAAGNTTGNGTIEVKTSITNVPPAGFVRISNGVGDDLYPYSSVSGTTFTLDAVTLTDTYTEDANVYPTIIDMTADNTFLNNTWVYTGDVDLAGQALDSGVSPTKAFPIKGTFGSTGYSVSVVRNPDE